MDKLTNLIIKYITVIFMLAVSLLSPLSALTVSAQDGEETDTSEVVVEGNLLEAIQERGSLRMGVASGYAPFEFIVNKNGENTITGSDVFLGERVAEDLGVELELVDMEFPNLITAMEAGNIDIIISGMTYTEERDETIDFSEIYHQDTQSFAIRVEDEGKYSNYQDVIDTNGVIGVQENTLQETLIREYFPKDAEIVVMRKSGDVISALQASQVDVVLLDDSVANAFAAENENLTVVDSGVEADIAGKAIGLPENQPALLAAINETVNEVNVSGQYEEWLEESYSIIEDSQQDTWLKYWPYFWDGIKTTLLISLVSIIVGTILGSVLALMRLSGIKILEIIARLYVEIVRGTPLMIQVLFVFIGLGSIFGWSTLTSGLVAVSLNSTAYICEIIRGGVNAVDKGQSEAARALGLDYRTTMRQVVFPQSLRSIWPSLGNEFVTLIKESSIVSTIGVAELTFQTRNVTSLSYRGVEPLIISMVLYLILTYSLTQLLNWYEKRMDKKYV